MWGGFRAATNVWHVASAQQKFITLLSASREVGRMTGPVKGCGKESGWGLLPISEGLQLIFGAHTYSCAVYMFPTIVKNSGQGGKKKASW